jgi:ribosomal protein L11 methyltransferase
MNFSGNTTLARLACDEATARRLADVLSERLESAETAVAAFEGTDGRWNVEIHFELPPDEAATRCLIAEVAGEAAIVTFATIAARDWVAASLGELKPVIAGRFTVHGAHDRAAVAPNRIGIEIEAALAFGTGHHGTTRGCLLALDEILRLAKPRTRPLPSSETWMSTPPRTASGGSSLPFPGKEFHVLDIGTGTGVLAIAAAKALRVSVLASDIDPEAVRIARENARLNGVSPWVECLHASGLAAQRFHACGPFDLVFANILLAPLKRLAAPLRPLLAPGALVVLSGLLATQENAALAAYRPHRLSLVRRIPLGEWVTLILAA